MKPNRLFNRADMESEDYRQFAQDYERAIPAEWIGNRMTTWEAWAGLEGLDWKQHRRVLDVGGFCSSVPFYLKSRGVESLAVDNYSWPNGVRQSECLYNSDIYEEVLRRRGIEAWEQDARFPFEMKQPPDLVTIFGTLEYVEDYGRVLHNMLHLCKQLVVTVAASPQGRAFDDESRVFSFGQVGELADLLDAEIQLEPWDEALDGQTIAVVRVVDIGRGSLIG